MALLKLARVLPLALFVLTLMPVTGANAQHFIKPRFKPPVEAGEEKFKISGRVVDKNGQPVSGCNVQLWEPSGAISMSCKNHNDGEFEFKHVKSDKLTLEVLPPTSLGFAQAIVRNLPGEEDRKMIVKLHRGYLVSGRVTCKKKGLKGILLKVEPLDQGLDGKAHLHGVGGGTTEKNGVFSMILTPGKKQLTVINEIYPQCTSTVTREFEVREDLHLGAIELK
ncbi:MAG: carboxypeptidase regulatory-like domain-containing protein [Candidatus Obscuribacter sp.]|nr:carboxypeptidase regulatory-like domain-containing protein [Candidatus Obscuribacter sp.]